MAAENSQMLKLAGGMAVGATALMMASTLKQSLKLGLRWAVEELCTDDLCWERNWKSISLISLKQTFGGGLSLLDVRKI